MVRDEWLPCPLCQAPGRPYLVKGTYHILDCPRCGHRYLGNPLPSDHVDQVYDDSYFSGGGAGYADYLAEAELLRQHSQRYTRLMARHRPQPGRVLDVGSAAGFLLQGFIEAGWNGCGIEPNDRMAEHARTQLNLDVRTGTLETVTLSESVDLVSFIQVLAHIPDPARVLRIADQWTKPGGYWLIETWNCQSLTARLWGDQWHEYSPPSVIHWWNPTTLRGFLRSLGYRPVASGIPQKWLAAGHAKSLLQHKAAEGGVARILAGAAALSPERLALPYPSEDLFWILVRKTGT